MVKRNAHGQSVVTSEIAKSRTKGHVVAFTLMVIMAGLIASGGASAAIKINPNTGVHQVLNLNLANSPDAIAVTDEMYKLIEEKRKTQSTVYTNEGLTSFDNGATSDKNHSYWIKNTTGLASSAITIGNTYLASKLQGETLPYAASANHISIGNGAKASNSISLGYFAQSGGGGAMAFGDFSKVRDHSGIAFGFASESYNSGVAIGAYSKSTSAQEVSFGNELLTRKLTNISAGTKDTDAVNVSQLKSLKSDINYAIGIAKQNRNNGETIVFAQRGDGIVVTKSTEEGINTYNVALDTNTKQSITKAQTDATQALTDAKAANDKATAMQTAVDSLKPIVDKNTTDIANLQETKADKTYVDSAIKNLTDSTLLVLNDISSTVNTISVEGGKNIITTTDDKGAVHVAMKDDIEMKSVSVEDSTIAITQDGINAGDKKVSHVADGVVAIDSKEAVNGSQLFAVKDTADKAHQTAQLADVKASDAQSTAKAAQTEAKVAKSTSDKAIAAVEKLNDTAVKYDDSSKDKVTLSGSQGTTIENVKDGAINATSQDAINGRQLHATNTQVMKNTQSINQLNGRVNQLDGKINKVNKEARAATAGAHAAAALPQVRGNGKSMMAVSAGSFKGENAIAIGYSRSNDNGNVLFKLHGATNSRGDIGGGIGIGYEW